MGQKNTEKQDAVLKWILLKVTVQYIVTCKL